LVIGANKLPSFRAAIQLIRERAFTRFEGIEAFPNLAVAVGIVISIIDACFIDIGDLMRQLVLQSFLKRFSPEVNAITLTPDVFFFDSSQSSLEHY